MKFTLNGNPLTPVGGSMVNHALDGSFSATLTLGRESRARIGDLVTIEDDDGRTIIVGEIHSMHITPALMEVDVRSGPTFGPVTVYMPHSYTHKYGDLVRLPDGSGLWMILGPTPLRHEPLYGDSLPAICIDPPSSGWTTGEIGGVWIDQCEGVPD